MRRKSSITRAAAFLFLGALAACGDELPTLVGEEHFPHGVRPLTLELEDAAVLTEYGAFAGYADPRAAPYLLIANAYGGVLNAHLLVRPTGFPDAITIGNLTYESFEVVGGGFMARLDTLTAGDTPVPIELWSVDQEWHAGSMTWTTAVDSGAVETAWQQPGGTRGELLAVQSWSPADTALAHGDTLFWELTTEQVLALREEESHGVLMRPGSADTRLQVTEFGLRVEYLVHRDTLDASRDTVVVRTYGGRNGWVFDPPPPVPTLTQGWWAGGVTGARTLIRVTLPDSVPGCDPPQDCPMVSIRDVSLAGASLLLDPLPAPAGFGPLGPALRLTLRRINEPELGRLAPLGAVVAERAVSPAAFEAGSDSVVVMRLTDHAARMIAQDSLGFSLALMVRTDGAGFGFARFAGLDPLSREGRLPPRFRLVYTLPTRQDLP